MRPVVHPVLLPGDVQPTARKTRALSPSLARGVLVWVEVEGRWQPYRVTRMEYSTLVVEGREPA
jgi:hypothetical protein